MSEARAFSFRCIRCGAGAPASVFNLFSKCCQLPFEIEYRDPAAAASPRLPLNKGHVSVSLGEGNTPVIELKKIGALLGLGKLWAKLEYQAPTGSFKDRGSAVLVSAAVEAGVREFVEDSSGNAGASLSAYAAAAGLKAHVFVPASAARGKLDQIAVFGATLHPVEGPRQAATDAARRFAEAERLPYLSHNLSPYFGEGMKGFAFEIAELPGPIDQILFPVGNGSLLVGAARGFGELTEAGKLARIPQLHAVQAEGVRPLLALLLGGPAAEIRPTVASGIAVSNPPRASQVVAAVRRTGGTGVAVADGAILEWRRRLAATEGIFCEATSAAALAGLEQLVRNGHIGPSDRVLLPITGSGLKEPLGG